MHRAPDNPEDPALTVSRNACKEQKVSAGRPADSTRFLTESLTAASALTTNTTGLLIRVLYLYLKSAEQEKKCALMRLCWHFNQTALSAIDTMREKSNPIANPGKENIRLTT